VLIRAVAPFAIEVVTPTWRFVLNEKFAWSVPPPNVKLPLYGDPNSPKLEISVPPLRV